MMQTPPRILSATTVLAADTGVGPAVFTHALSPLGAGTRYPLRSLHGLDGLRGWGFDAQQVMAVACADGARAQAQVSDTALAVSCGCARLMCAHGLAAAYMALGTGSAPGWLDREQLRVVRGQLGHYLGARTDLVGLLACAVGMRGLLAHAPAIHWRAPDRARPIAARSARATLFGA